MTNEHTSAYTADHWWWRPGWGPGTRFYTWHLTFAQSPDVHRIAGQYRKALAPVGGLDLVPDAWLHLTMQGVGFTEQVEEGDLLAILAAARRNLSEIGPFDIELDRPVFTPEAIRWDPVPAQPVVALRLAIRRAIGEAWAEVPEVEEGFSPHVTIAYCNTRGPAAPVLAALATPPGDPVNARVTHADLIVLGRDRKMYEWETYASVPLAG